ncbi:MAG: sugar phosphate isomerase/epimerase family protein [Pseudomonadota bacterium]
MKFAFSSNAFLRYDLFETIRFLSEIGYEGIEIMADVPHAFPLHLTDSSIMMIRAALENTGLTISNINAFMHHADGDTYHPSWIEKSPDLRAKRVDYTLRCIELADRLGVRNISTEPGGPLEEMSSEEGLRLFREGLGAVEDKAREKCVRVLIEPEPGLLIENSLEFLDFFDGLDPEVFGLNFDIGHFFCVNEDPAELVEIMKGYTHHFHLEDIAPSREHHHLMPGHGAIDLNKVLNAIEDSGFDGFVTVELYTYEHAAKEAATEALEYLRQWKSNGGKD